MMSAATSAGGLLLWARAMLAQAASDGAQLNAADTMAGVLQALRVFRTNDCHAEVLECLVLAATWAVRMACSRSALACAVLACGHPLAGPGVQAAVLLPAVNALALRLRIDEAWAWYHRTRRELHTAHATPPLQAALHTGAAFLHLLSAERACGHGSVYAVDRPRARPGPVQVTEHLQKARRHADAGLAIAGVSHQRLQATKAQALALSGQGDEAFALLCDGLANAPADTVAHALSLARCEMVLGLAPHALARLRQALIDLMALHGRGGTSPSLALAQLQHDLHSSHLALGQAEQAAQHLLAYLSLFAQARAADRDLLTDLAHAMGRDPLADDNAATSYWQQPWLDQTASTLGLAAAAKAHEIVYTDPGSAMTPGSLAERCGVSLRTLQAQVRREYNLSIRELIRSRRMALAHELVSCTALPLNTLMTRLGYVSLAAFKRDFSREHGVQPAALRQALRAG